jgi:hypothetical protein
MYENRFGVPDTLPDGYGGGAPSTVRMNAGSPAVAHTVSMRPASLPGRPLGHMPAPAVAVVRFSDLEDDDEADLDDSYDYGYEFAEGYGGFGAVKEGPAIKRDKKLKLKYRDVGTAADPYIYRQYSNGSYAIIQGKTPAGVTLGVPFTAKENAKAFAAIKAEVEKSVGPFPAGAKPSKASKKKGKKKGKKVDAGKLAMRAVETAGKISYKFLPSGAEAPAVEEEGGAGGGAAAEEETTEAWYARKFLGLPTWGWIGVGTVAAAATVYFVSRGSTTPAAGAPPASRPAMAKKAAPRPAETEAEADAEVGEE